MGVSKPMQIINAFTVDVEDYYQVSAFEKHIRRDHWDRWESRVEANTHRILRLLERHGVKATFFVLGWVAERHPRLVREIHSCGHEVGSHGYWHRLVYELSPAEFREDLRRSRRRLEDAVGARVTAHRAASFSITSRSLWALEILVEEGFSVDSSIFPIHHDRYGIPRRTAAAPSADARRRALGVSPFGGPHGSREPSCQWRRIFQAIPAVLDALLSRPNQPPRAAALYVLRPSLGGRPAAAAPQRRG